MINDNSTRARADRQTQRRVVDAARESFLRVGYIGTTIRGTAETAGVALLDRRRTVVPGGRPSVTGAGWPTRS